MILLDLNNVFYASVFALVGQPIDEAILRHVVLNCIRNNYTKFKRDFGPHMIIADDGCASWRKSVFPQYKFRRHKDRTEQTQIDWPTIHKFFPTIKAEIQNFFPYGFVRYDRAEADDVIAITVRHADPEEKILIISGDKDMIQLHEYPNVVQFAPIQKAFLKPATTPGNDLREKVLHGDSGDGIPNVLSDADTFTIEGKRQQRLTKGRKEEIVKLVETYEKQALNMQMNVGTPGPTVQLPPNYLRNYRLISFECIPRDVENGILVELSKVNKDDVKKRRSGLFNYFFEKQLTNLMGNIGDF
jgi:5'-3' exonuclease